ncbi:PAS domain S-box protein [Kovacikia minuta CCNUW1]|uniref:PAS domain S-box protein n=1 Tax=Kovacikia minuta TaxID=2931930 RepID=UPI001CCCDBD7|nr:PAS domain S-box protein [Kovacikia minuta]UBF25343.1 PAS domain S-box protein [Kovacikia minuta CCNUW1]
MPAWINGRFPRLSYQSALRTAAKPENSLLQRYGVAVIAMLVALLLMLLLNPWVPMGASPFLLFFAAVMVSAWYGGFGPGFLATILASLAASYFFLPPFQNFRIAAPADMVRLGIFLLISLMICLLSGTRRQLVKELRQERDLISAVVSTAGSLIVVMDRQGRIVEFNRTCEKTTGYSFEAVRGKHLWDLLLPPEEIEPTREMFYKFGTWLFPNEYEGVWITHRGDRRLIVWSNTVLQDDLGAVKYVIGTGIDITDRKHAEETLQETNQTLQALIQASPLAITVLDRLGRVKLWNPAAEKLFGWSQEEVLGRFLPTVPDHKMSEFQANVASTLRGDLINAMETVRQRKDGSAIHIGLWTAVLRGSQAEDDSILSLMADLSQNKQAEVALKLSQERLTRFVEANVIGIVFADIDGPIEQANDAFLRMVGYAQTDLDKGHLSWVDITPPEYLPLDEQHIAEAKARGASTPYEKEYIRPDGIRVPVLVGFTLIGEERQEAVAFVLDLTERKQLEQTLRQQAEELAEANRMKDEFLAVLSHELRTPLNSMLGWSRLLRSRQLDAETTARALETIERNARLQTQLIEDILDVSKMIRGKLRLQPQSVSLPPVIEAAIDAMRPAAAAKAIHLSLQIDDCRLEEHNSRSEVSPTSVQTSNLPPEIDYQKFQVSGDSDRLQQVFWNLLSNAIKFTPEGGQVTIRLSAIKEQTGIWTREYGEKERSSNGGERSYVSIDPPIFFTPAAKISYAEIAVTDTGKGINPEFLPYVFDRFRQADSTTTRADGGLGLGLAIARHLVELHGGTIWAESLGAGLGATFTVRLPLINGCQPSDGKTIEST